MSNESQKPALTQARVISAFELNGVPHRIDDIVELDDATLRIHRREVDANPAAVAYCLESQQKKAARQRLIDDAL